VRWGELPYPEPDVASINTLKAKVASGELPRSEIDRMETLYAEFFENHPDLRPSNTNPPEAIRAASREGAVPLATAPNWPHARPEKAVLVLFPNAPK